jgi:hypothetical protein
LQGACTTFFIQAPAVAPDIRARPASEFVDSVGVCVHLASEPYKSRFAVFRELLKASGIRHLRDELLPGNDLSRWQDLQTHLNIKWNLLVSPVTNSTDQMLDYVKTLGPEHFSAVEGQNEGDTDWFIAQNVIHGNWSGAVVAYQRDIYHALRQFYSASMLPVISPTLLDWKPNDVAVIRSAASFSDIVGLHSYVQHAQEPETEEPYAALSWYVRNYRDSFKVNAPFMVTEAGYMNVIAPGKSGISEWAASIYLPRLLLYNFSFGAERTFLYEFMNGGPDARDNEQNYGLVRDDGTPKPAFHTISTLMRALDDRSLPAFARKDDRPVQLSFGNAPPDFRQQTFTLRDGRLIVALWRACRSWDVERGTDISNLPVMVSIGTGKNFTSAERLIVDDASHWQKAQMTAGFVDIPVNDRVTLLRLAEHDV